MRRLLLLLSAVIPLAVAAATTRFDDALALYVKGADELAPEHEEYNVRANETFQKLLEAEPVNPLYMAYYGSTWVMKARDAVAPWNKLKHVERGLGYHDKSLLLLEPENDRVESGRMPVSVRVRGAAAISFIRVPNAIFKRLDQGDAMLQQLVDSPLLKNFSGDDKAYLYYYAGEAARLKDDLPRAKMRYQTVLTLTPESSYATLARRALEKLN